MIRLPFVRACLVWFAVPVAAYPQSTSEPRLMVLERMRAAYAGKWYTTLTFTQRTVVTGGAAKPDSMTWYESISGTRLRIDIGDPSLGNGMLYTPDSTYIVRNGQVTRAAAGGNPFLPLIQGVYIQPVAQTVRELKTFGFDLTRMTTGTWEGRRVVIVGASSVSDSTSAQFWVDDRNLVVRVLGAIVGSPRADIRIGGYVKVGEAWLGTRLSIIMSNRTQMEEYDSWRANVPLSPELFDLSRWKSAPHWAVVKKEPVREVQGNALTSSELPALRIEFDSSFRFAGVIPFRTCDVATGPMPPFTYAHGPVIGAEAARHRANRESFRESSRCRRPAV
jgi:hypothetical protein